MAVKSLPTASPGSQRQPPAPNNLVEPYGRDLDADGHLASLRQCLERYGNRHLTLHPGAFSLRHFRLQDTLARNQLLDRAAPNAQALQIIQNPTSNRANHYQIFIQITQPNQLQT